MIFKTIGQWYTLSHNNLLTRDIINELVQYTIYPQLAIHINQLVQYTIYPQLAIHINQLVQYTIYPQLAIHNKYMYICTQCSPLYLYDGVGSFYTNTNLTTIIEGIINPLTSTKASVQQVEFFPV